MAKRPGDGLFDHFNGKERKPPAPAPAEPSEPRPLAAIVADTSAFELLSRHMEPEELRILRRFLIEWAKGDENSYLFQHVLITIAQWRMAAAVPIETAKVFEQYKHVAQEGVRQIAQAAEAKLADFVKMRAEIGEILADLKARVAQLDTVAQAAEERLGRLTRDFEAVVVTARAHMEQELAARRQWIWAWALGAGIVVAAVGWFATYQLERQAGERWKAEQTAQLAQWRAQQEAQWPRWAESQAQVRLQALEPATYRLAQQIERSKRKVKLPDGEPGWEVTFFDEGGILSVDTTFDAQNIRQRFQVHLRDDPERSALSATAPAAGNSGKERPRP